MIVLSTVNIENMRESVHTLRNVWNVANRVHCIIAFIML
jgi:hypothetical protein